MPSILRPLAKRKACLRVKVDHQDAFTLLDEGAGKIDRGCFADSAFLICDDDNTEVHIYKL